VDADGFQEVMGRGKRSRNTSRMDDALQAEGEEDIPSSRRRRRNRTAKTRAVSVDDGNFFSSLQVEEPSDIADDDDFSGKSSSESGTETNSARSQSDSEIEEITNEEASRLLHFKLVWLVQT
jgi:hypothetical protein